MDSQSALSPTMIGPLEYIVMGVQDDRFTS